jgi:hypothetical protein
MTMPLSKAERAPPEARRVSLSVAAAVADSALLANGVCTLAMDAMQAANGSDPDMPHGDGRISVALGTRHLRYRPADPYRADRGRLVLSSSHASMLRYAPKRLSGYALLPLDEIKHCRQLNSMTPGHPEVGMMGYSSVSMSSASHRRRECCSSISPSRPDMPPPLCQRVLEQ